MKIIMVINCVCVYVRRPLRMTDFKERVGAMCVYLTIFI